MSRKILMLGAFVSVLAACDSTTGPEGAREVAVRFQAASSSQPASAMSPSASTAQMPGTSFDHTAGTGAITLAGSNGTLVIEDLRVIVSEIELERTDGACLVEEDDDDCEEFEGGPFLVNLLDGSATEVVTAIVPAGTYTEFEFEVENLDLDGDDDSSEQQVKQSILADLRQTYPAFPSRGSMVMHGTFDGEPFTVYFDAEIEVEREFFTPFRVPEDGAILVELDPAAWFQAGSQVLDPRPYDGQTLEIELQFESGVEIDHDD
jgi:hypothetical protein